MNKKDIFYYHCYAGNHEYEYSYPRWCIHCKQFISAKECIPCHNKKFHYEEFHYFSYEQKIGKLQNLTGRIDKGEVK